MMVRTDLTEGGIASAESIATDRGDRRVDCGCFARGPARKDSTLSSSQQNTSDEGDRRSCHADGNQEAAAKARKGRRLDNDGSPIYSRRQTTPRPAKQGVIPVKKTCWWVGVKTGRLPNPVELGPRVTPWRIDNIRALIESA